MDRNHLRSRFRERAPSDLFLAFNLAQTGVTVAGALVLLLFMLLAAPGLRYFPMEVLVRGALVGLLGGIVSVAVNGRYLLALRSLHAATEGKAPLDAGAAELLPRAGSALPFRLLVLTLCLWPTLPILLALWFWASRLVNREDAIRMGITGILYAPLQGLILFYTARLLLRRLVRLAREARIELPEAPARRRFGLRAKLTLIGAGLAIVPLLAGMLIGDARREKLQTDANLAGVCEALDRVFARATKSGQPNWQAAFSDPAATGSVPAGTAFQVSDGSGSILAGGLSLDARMMWSRLLGSGRAECFWRPAPGGTDFLVLRHYPRSGIWMGAETRPIPPRPPLLKIYGGGLALAALALLLGVIIALLAAEDLGGPVRELSQAAARAERGEYEAVAGVVPDDELGELAQGYNRLVVSVTKALERSEGLLGRARGVSEGLADQAERIRGLVARNREVIDEQRSLSVEAGGGAEEVTRAAGEIKERARHTSLQMDEASESCQVCSHSLVEVTRGMEGVVQASTDLGREMEVLEENYRRMEEIVRIIDDIAGRAEMLGLNAALEVSREEGRGGRFGVVATEVQRLSERISQETAAIKLLFGEVRRSSLQMARAIDVTRARAAEAPGWLQELDDSITGIESRSTGASDSMREIVHMTEQQSQALEQMKVMVAEIRSVAAVMDEGSSGAESATTGLRQLAEELRKLLH